MSPAKYFILVCIILCAVGCDPTRFTMVSDRNVDCRVYSDHRLVSHSLTDFTLAPEGCVAVTYLWATQHLATFRLTLTEGMGVTIMLRPIVEESIIDSGLVLTLTRNGYTLRNGDTMLVSKSLPALREGKMEIFRSYSDEGYLELTLGCDTLYKGITLRKEGDDIIFATLPESRAVVYGPSWRDLEIIEMVPEATRTKE